MRSIQKQLKFVNFLLLLTLSVSLFYLLYNTVLSENNYKLIGKLKNSIRNLDSQIEREKEKNGELKNLYLRLSEDKNNTVENFIRSYLFMVKKDEAVILKGNN